MAKNTVGYVDGFVLTVPKKKLIEYRKMAREAEKIWKKYGALDYKECVIDDTKPKWVTFTFPKMAKAKKGEQVWFSYIAFKSRAHRDQVNTKVMAYFDKKYADKKNIPMPFDMKRMAYGGFKVMVGA
jgi:alkaline phosphatase